MVFAPSVYSATVFSTNHLPYKKLVAITRDSVSSMVNLEQMYVNYFFLAIIPFALVVQIRA